MPHCNFSPNTKITGGAAFWKLTRENAVILTAFPQVANNPDKKNNFNFKAGGLNIKLSLDEVAGVVRAIRTKSEFKFYHEFTKDGNKTVSKGAFSFYAIPAKDKFPEKSGFGLTVDKDGTVVKVGYSLDVAENLMGFLQYCLSLTYRDTVDEDDKRDAEFQANKGSKSEPESTTTPAKVAPKKTAAKKVAASSPEPEPEVEEEVASEKTSEEEEW